MTGRRFVNVKHNLLTRLDDSDLLQYGLKSAHDLQAFFSKLANFDFHSNRFYCKCPRGPESLVSIWSLNQRIALNFRTNQNLRKQINRIISLLILNVSYIIFPLPISIVAFFYTPKDIEFIASFYFKMIAYLIEHARSEKK